MYFVAEDGGKSSSKTKMDFMLLWKILNGRTESKLRRSPAIPRGASQKLRPDSTISQDLKGIHRKVSLISNFSVSAREVRDNSPKLGIVIRQVLQSAVMTLTPGYEGVRV